MSAGGQQQRSCSRRRLHRPGICEGSSDAGGSRGRFVRESPRRVDPDCAHEVAARFQAARDNRTDRTVRAAYDQLARQSDVIFARLTDPDGHFLRGLRVEFTRCESPYDSDEELVGAARTHGVLEITASAGDRDRRHPLLDCDRGGSVRQVSCRPRHRWTCGPLPRLRPRRGIRSLADPGASLRRTRPMGSGHRAPRRAQRSMDHRNALRPQGNPSRPGPAQQGSECLVHRRSISFGVVETGVDPVTSRFSGRFRPIGG